MLCLLAAAAAQAQEVTITGLALEVTRQDERLLVRAAGPLRVDLAEPSPRLVVVTLHGAALAEGVPQRLSGSAGASLQRVVAQTAASPGGAELRLQIRHASGRRPLVQLTDEGAEIVFARGTGAPARQAAGARPEPMLDLAMRNGRLSDLIRKVATQTGETILMESDISKLISIIGARRYTPREARALLDTALLLHGHVAVPMPGGGSKIVPIGGAPLPWVAELEAQPDDAPVTTLVRLSQIEASFMLNAIQPLLGSGTIAVVEASSNGILLAGSGRRVGRLRDAMRLLDDVGTETQVVWSVEHRQAGELLALLEDAFPDDLGTATVDERTNRLVLQVRAERADELRRFVSRMDRPPVGRGALHVLRVRNADPEVLAQHLQGLAAGGRGLEGSLSDAPLSNRDFSIQVDDATSSLVLRADPVTAQIIADLVAELDVSPARVRVYVTVSEVIATDDLQLGFNAFLPISTPRDARDTIAVIASTPSGGLGATTAPTGNFTTRVTVLPFFEVVDSLGNSVLVNRGSFAIAASSSYMESRLLLAPELLVASGEAQEIFVGDNIPILTSTDTADTSPGGALRTRQNVERHDAGVLVRVTPTVGAEGGVRLELLIEVSAVSQASLGAVERVGPTIGERSIEAVVHLHSDATAVLAFATQPMRMRSLVGTPWLSRIPVLGALFRSTLEETRTSTLIATVRAAIERDGARALTRALEAELARWDEPLAPAAPVGG